MKASFVWSSEFETGLEHVDEQHHHLVELINQFSDRVLTQQVSEKDVVILYVELTDYAHYHFAEEEALMEKYGVHPDVIENHREIHKGFSEQLGFLKRHLKLDSMTDWQTLLDFLYQWLGHHILGLDQSMARQIALIKEGVSAKEAMEQELDIKEHDGVEPLLEALMRMIRVLSTQYEEINELNEHLEDKVEERTAELAHANEKLRVISLTDALTELPNRRHAMEKLQDCWQESEDNQKPLSCMMIDADYFKEVNDTHGHDAGDKVLCELARTLVHSVRNDDMVSRLGGDEFFVICPNTDLAGCENLARQLLDKVKELQVATGDGYWRSSVSIGVAEKTGAVKNPEQLLKKSDDSVYLAKDSGRGCVQAVQPA